MKVFKKTTKKKHILRGNRKFKISRLTVLPRASHAAVLKIIYYDNLTGKQLRKKTSSFGSVGRIIEHTL